MCIIAIKKPGVSFPKMETMKEMCKRNPDGFALAWHIKGQKHSNVVRTLSEDEMMEYYKELIKYDPNDVSMFLHARIKTHGTVKRENCHGWKSEIARTIFAHNGILSIDNRGDMTDSETFYRDIFEPIFKLRGWRGAEKAIDAVIGTSKFVFLDAKGNLRHYGNYIKENDGMLYSNTSYKPIEYGFYNYANQIRSSYYPSSYGQKTYDRHQQWQEKFDSKNWWDKPTTQDSCVDDNFGW